MKSLKEILRSLEGLSDIELFVIDLFCGAGGLSEGVEAARLDGNKCAKVVCCVNHDKNAILSHDANIPDALHFIEDIRTLELSPISTIVERIRQLYPDAMIMLHASLECTNFSKAKGGQPRDADSRTLAEHLFRYIDVIDPDYIQIENVEEFMSWGDMDENGKPISMDKGRLYQKWVRNVKKYGYNFEHRILNAADFGAYTTVKRMAEHGNGIALLFNRCDSKMFQDVIFEKATAMKFLRNRIRFFRPDGTRGDSPGCGSILIAFGEDNAEVIKTCDIAGKYVRIN